MVTTKINKQRSSSLYKRVKLQEGGFKLVEISHVDYAEGDTVINHVLSEEYLNDFKKWERTINSQQKP
jgi:hypothetical protein